MRRLEAKDWFATLSRMYRQPLIATPECLPESSDHVKICFAQFLVHVCPTASCKLPAMSNHREMEHADGFELLQIDAHGVNGEGFLIRIPASNTGKDLQQEIASQIPQKPGSHISLQHESNKLSLRKSLKEQGFHGKVALSYVYTKVDFAIRVEIPGQR